MNNITIYRNDTDTIKLILKDENRNPINLTGWKIYFTVKKYKTDTDDVALLKKDITDFPNPYSGEVEIRLTTSETNLLGTHYYDVQAKNDRNEIITLVSGNIIFTEDITKRTI